MSQPQRALIDLRRERGRTIRQMGVDQAYYVALEHGRRLPGPRALRQMAAATDLPCETLFAACQESCRQATKDGQVVAGAHAAKPTEGGGP